MSSALNNATTGNENKQRDKSINDFLLWLIHLKSYTFYPLKVFRKKFTRATVFSLHQEVLKHSCARLMTVLNMFDMLLRNQMSGPTTFQTTSRGKHPRWNSCINVLHKPDHTDCASDHWWHDVNHHLRSWSPMACCLCDGLRHLEGPHVEDLSYR